MERDPTDPSVADLVERAARQTADLVRQEIQLAQAELQDKGRRAGIGVGLLGAAGLVALYGVAALVAALIMLLALAVEPWIAALIVGAVLLAGAGGLALVGRSQAQRATPPIPERALESVQDDVRHVKERVER